MNSLLLMAALIAHEPAPSPVIIALARQDSPVEPASKPASAPASAPANEGKLTAENFAGLAWRSIGPSLMEGRIVDIAVNPKKSTEYYIAVGCGGVWKTTNASVSWSPVFDGQASFSIGCVTIDPNNTHVVWVGTGENNSQRSVSFGDGVYRSRDGGQSWENMGLKDSEHIGMIRVDPRNSNVVYVAAQGPLWRSGGERGLYKTTNGGATWTRILHVSDDTGIGEVHFDPRDPDVLYAAAYQRRRHVWTLVNGGPESAIYKSTDAGASWRKLTRGLPDVDKGRIGLGVSPANADIVYATIEAAEDKSGFFRSTDRGETWEKRSGWINSNPQYYTELFCDPRNADRVYAEDTFMSVTEDGGKSISHVPLHDTHVDSHVLWINPANTDHLLMGCDGGLYESFDRGANWNYRANLPIMQFYRVCVDNAKPFYNVYGGTQDNNTLGGPSRTTERIGIANEHWFNVTGGDGFKPQVDPEDPNIVYGESQHGGLVRFDRQTGEELDIKPREAPGEEPLRWNWDSPLLISPHDHHRIYFAANKLFRSDDRGESWTAISPDLTRRLDRNKLPVMGIIQLADAVAKNVSTSFYGNIVSLSESPVQEGLIYVGTDDGLIQTTEDGGKTWRKSEQFPGVPEQTYVSCLLASVHDADSVFAAFDNHKRGDFKPYLFRSPNRGRDWVNIAGDLPARDIVYSIVQDPLKSELVFAGTEFGVYFTVDGGIHWFKLSSGLPSIAVREIAIQPRENDLVLATFGRGFYVLDDYSPLRLASAEMFARDAVVFPIKPALRYIPHNRMGGWSGKGTQGASFYAASNPPFGAVFTYYLRDKITTRKERRKEAEKKAKKEGGTPPYPTIDDLRAEDQEREPAVILIVKDAEGATVRRITASRDNGLHRAAWDLRYPASTPTQLSAGGERAPWDIPPSGAMAPPGNYTGTLVRDVDGVVTELAEPQNFIVRPLDEAIQVADAPADVRKFRARIARLQRAVQGASRAAGEADTRIKFIRQAILDTPGVDATLLGEADRLQSRLNALLIRLRGDSTRARRNEPTPISINERVDSVVYSQWYVTAPPTQTQRDGYRFAGTEFTGVLGDLKTLMETDLPALEKRLESAGAPWTPGRLPEWTMEND